MAKSNPGSFYTLEMDVAPGGCRRADCFVLTDLERVKSIVTEDLSRGIGVYLIAWYGEDVLVTAHVPGKKPRSVDLLPFITVRLRGYPDITFPGGHCSFDFEEDDEEHEEDEEKTLASKLFRDAIKPKVIIDWEAAKIPPLPEPILPEGTSVWIKPHYGGKEQRVMYGHNSFDGDESQGMDHPALTSKRPRKRASKR
jgi:hypothetical protein